MTTDPGPPEAGIISLQDLRSRMKLDIKDEKSRLEPMRLAVISAFEAATMRPWSYREDYVIKMRLTPAQRRVQNLETGRGGQLWIPLTPIETIELVEYDFDEKVADGDEVTEDLFDFDAETGRVWRVDSDTWDPFVQATVTGGWTNAAAIVAPEMHMIREAMIQQVLFWMDRLVQDKRIISQQGFEGGSTNYLGLGKISMFEEVISQNIWRRA